MRNKSKIIKVSVFFYIISILSSQSCKKKNNDNPWTAPTIKTLSVLNITKTTAEGNGYLVNDGGAPLTASGFCWSISDNPTIKDSFTNDASDTGVYTSQISGLSPSTQYFARAYATNRVGTSYGEVYTFYTQGVPVLTTKEVINITSISSTCGGIIKYSGGSSVINRGICWSTNPNPTILDNKVNSGTGPGEFDGNITGILGGLTYYVRAFATNSDGTGYGNTVTFTSQNPTLPSLTTSPITNINQLSAECGGNITNNGGANILSKGVCWSVNPNPTITNSKSIDGTGTGLFTSEMKNLSPGTKYYVRAYATNNIGTTYGNELNFNTQNASVPTLTTTSITNITSTSANSGGTITSDGASIVNTKGICWSTSPNPTISNNVTYDGSGVGSFSSILTGLTRGNTYYVRAYAKNAIGTGYGNELSFYVPLVIGQSYQGGIVAYILQSGDVGYDANVQHGLIAATSDQSTGVMWDKGNNSTTNATSTSIGSGSNNTTLIISKLGSGTFAAIIAKNYTVGSYTDWFLPSYDELVKMYQNRNSIGNFSSAAYWSSSDLSFSAARAVDFSAGTGGSSLKYNLLRVRAIRKF